MSDDEKVRLGGMALPNGVLVHGPNSWACAIRHEDGRIEEAHVFDRWWHVGTARDEDELAALAETRAEIGFDPDVYKILQAHIRKRRASVQELAPPSYLDLAAAE